MLSALSSLPTPTGRRRRPSPRRPQRRGSPPRAPCPPGMRRCTRPPPSRRPRHPARTHRVRGSDTRRGDTMSNHDGSVLVRSAHRAPHSIRDTIPAGTPGSATGDCHRGVARSQGARRAVRGRCRLKPGPFRIEEDIKSRLLQLNPGKQALPGAREGGHVPASRTRQSPPRRRNRASPWCSGRSPPAGTTARRA